MFLTIVGGSAMVLCLGAVVIACTVHVADRCFSLLTLPLEEEKPRVSALCMLLATASFCFFLFVTILRDILIFHPLR